MRVAREHQIPLSVRGGGHGFWGRAIRADGITRWVRIDADRRPAVIGGGALSSDVVSAGEKVGLTATTSTAGAVARVWSSGTTMLVRQGANHHARLKRIDLWADARFLLAGTPLSGTTCIVPQRRALLGSGTTTIVPRAAGR